MNISFAKNATEYATTQELAQLESAIKNLPFPETTTFYGKLENAGRNARVTFTKVSKNTGTAMFEYMHAKHGNWTRIFGTITRD